MERQIRVIGVKRKEIDEEKLALAFLLLAKTINEHRSSSHGDEGTDPTKTESSREAA